MLQQNSKVLALADFTLKAVV